MNKKIGYVVYFADCKICTIYADELIINEQMVYLIVKNNNVGVIYMTKHHDIKRYNIIGSELVSISHFILEGNKVIETIEAV